MKRYGIYITVILILLSGTYFNGFAQLNSSIESIQKTYPITDTIFDPAEDSLIIQIRLENYFIWGNTPPDSIGFFSLTNNYSWVKKLVSNTTLFQPEYKSVSPVYYFNQEVNTVYFWLFDPDNEIDTISGFKIIYNKPQVELLSVEPADIVPGTAHYVVYESNPKLAVNGESWFPSTELSSFITKIELKDEATSFYYTLWENASGVAQKEIEVDLPSIFTLEPGLTRSFALRATGMTDDDYTGPVETSAEFPFRLTYMSIEVPDTICQVNSNISLEAYPLGGSFEGKGIVDNTSLFNPFLADANAYNTVTYRLIIEGSEFSVTKNIYVIDLPVVELDGELEVCANSTDVKYTILNADTSKYDYIWKFTGVAEIIDSTAVSTILRWQSDPGSYTGKISISLESKNETQFCPAIFEYLVDIDPDNAPDKPCVCFGDISRRLLLCSNTQAAYFKWFINEADSIGFSDKPYFYLTEDIIKYNDIDNSTIFTVRIANQLTGCYTTGFMCGETFCVGNEQSSMLIGKAGDELEIAIRTNPVRDNIYLKTSGNYSGKADLKVYTMNGTLILTRQLNKVLPSEDHVIALNAGLKPGFYLVSCQYGDNRTSPVKMIVY
jgi:hypothetical protein